METQAYKPLFPGLFTLLSCIFMSLSVVTVRMPSNSFAHLLPFVLSAGSGLYIRLAKAGCTTHCRSRRTSHPHPRMRPLLRSWLRYNRKTSKTTLSPQKPVSSYGPAPVRALFRPVRALFRPVFRHFPDTKSPRMRPPFRSCFRYDRKTIETTFSYENLRHSYDGGLTRYEYAPSRPVSPATKCPRKRPPSPSWLRYNHETTNTNPVRPEPVEGHPIVPVPNVIAVPLINVIAAKAAIQTNGAKWAEMGGFSAFSPLN